MVGRGPVADDAVVVLAQIEHEDFISGYDLVGGPVGVSLAARSRSNTRRAVTASKARPLRKSSASSRRRSLMRVPVLRTRKNSSMGPGVSYHWRMRSAHSSVASPSERSSSQRSGWRTPDGGLRPATSTAVMGSVCGNLPSGPTSSTRATGDDSTALRFLRAARPPRVRMSIPRDAQGGRVSLCLPRSTVSDFFTPC